MKRDKKDKVAAVILKELEALECSDWNKEKDGFHCSIYREDAGQFQCYLRSDRQFSNIEVVLKYGDIDVFVSRFKNSEKENEIVRMFEKLDRYFKKRSEEERLVILDKFLNG